MDPIREITFFEEYVSMLKVEQANLQKEYQDKCYVYDDYKKSAKQENLQKVNQDKCYDDNSKKLIANLLKKMFHKIKEIFDEPKETLDEIKETFDEPKETFDEIKENFDEPKETFGEKLLQELVELKQTLNEVSSDLVMAELKLASDKNFAYCWDIFLLPKFQQEIFEKMYQLYPDAVKEIVYEFCKEKKYNQSVEEEMIAYYREMYDAYSYPDVKMDNQKDSYTKN